MRVVRSSTILDTERSEPGRLAARWPVKRESKSNQYGSQALGLSSWEDGVASGALSKFQVVHERTLILQSCIYL